MAPSIDLSGSWHLEVPTGDAQLSGFGNVTLINDGTFRGGDEAFTWSGSYSSDDSTFTLTGNYIAGQSGWSVFGQFFTPGMVIPMRGSGNIIDKNRAEGLIHLIDFGPEPQISFVLTRI